MNYFKFDIAFYPRLFGMGFYFEKMLLTSNFKYRFTFQILWVNVSLLMVNKHLPKF